MGASDKDTVVSILLLSSIYITIWAYHIGIFQLKNIIQLAVTTLITTAYYIIDE